ncbi:MULTISPECIES: ABC transporter family substrate-binding protein [unclassified Streptomyces]|uniref:ABC transporter family substrate-binding protein n=1 Tax=unclassified Streptomyces TaxID=2593676 RepID=UPI0003703857|nr:MULTISPECIES: ABC transporter family substrate-binding protein [unclassified Streptomyces]MYT31675.1 ABC transporter family substrate-binding protein [Streptomyces sp. SID8354]
MTDHVSPDGPVARRRRGVALVAVGALLPLPVLAGCSQGDSAPSVAQTQDIAPAPRGSVRDGGTVRWAVDALPSTFNAFQSDADATTTRVTGAVLPSLFTLDANGRPQRNADYLAAADISAREPRQVVTYRLNPKARWSDGRPITAADFVAQWQALRGKDNAYWTARNAGYDRIATVAAGAAPHEVKVTFARPYADWQALFTPLYPKSVMGDANAFNDAVRRKLPVGAGPFLVGKRDAGHGTVTLVRNPRWWGDRAKLDKLVLTALPRDKRAKALAAGTVDVAAVDQAAARQVAQAAAPATAGGADAKGAAARSSALRGYVLRKALEPAYTQLALNGSAGPLADRRVRRAVARAIDRQALAGSVLKPLDLPARPLGNHLLMAGQHGYEDHSDALGDTDAGAAKQLLSDAGWKPAPGAADRSAGEERAGAGRAVPPDRADDGATDDSTADEPGGDTAADQSGDGRNPQRPGDHDGARPAAAEAPLSSAGAVGSEVQQAALLRQSAAFYKAEAATEKAAAAGNTGSPAYRKYRRYKKRAAQALGAAEMIETGQAPHLPGAAAGHAAALRNGLGAFQARQAGTGHSPAAAAGRAPHRAPDGAAVLRKDGRPLTLRFVLPDGPGSEQLRTVGRRIAGMLNKIGVRTAVQRVPDASYFRDHIAAGDFDLALYSWPGTAYPATDARPIFAKPQPAPDGSLTVEQNYARVGTDHIDQLFDQAASELDPDAARTLVEQADARIWAAAGSIPLYQRPELVATRKSLANIGAFGFATPRFQDIGYSK